MSFNVDPPKTLKTRLWYLLLHCSLLFKYWVWAWVSTMEKEHNVFVGLFVQFYKTHRMGKLECSHKNPTGFLI